MCWDFVGTTIEKVKVSCKLQRTVFNFIITFSTKGMLKWRMFGMYLEIGLHMSYIIHFTLKLKRNGHIHILDGSVSRPQKAFLYAFNFFNNENFLLDICSQQFGEKMSVEFVQVYCSVIRTFLAIFPTDPKSYATIFFGIQRTLCWSN